MFGGQTLYCDEKVVALICDGQLFLKLTASTSATDLQTAPPYPGAKPFLVVDDDLLRQRTKLRNLVQATADALPPPKPKRARQRKAEAKK